MHALIVTAHPESTSLTHSIAARIAEGISQSGPENSFELADLTAEGFDPRFTEADLAVHREQAPPPADVAAEQARIDRADALVLVYPVYWWSMPGLLKGWIDRVFANGWAYDEGPNTKLVKKLQRLKVHLVGIGGADAGTWTRHGYFDAIKKQIDHGIFDYCGACVVTSELMLGSQTPDQAAHFDAALAIGRNIFSASEQSRVAEAA
jgi:NAD(P)H dehydrogenase (quinone)